MTGYAEYRASLAARKNYRKAEDIDLRLPLASTAFGGAPRMRNYPPTEEGRREWKEAFNKHAGGFLCVRAHVAAGTVKKRDKKTSSVCEKFDSRKDTGIGVLSARRNRRKHGD